MLGARAETARAGTAWAMDPEGTRTAYRVAGITDEGRCEAPARFGGIHAVVHVAALDSRFGGPADAVFAAWRAVLDVNLPGTLRMTRADPPELRAIT
ncbi:hypothetical protein SUDANB178_04190 [Streptomyces sp. enrichment culture]